MSDPDNAGPEATDAPDRWETLLKRYVRVWIWSILFGTTTGLSYAYVTLRTDRPWGTLIMFPLSILVLGLLATFSAWWNLYVHLILAIIPEFFPSATSDHTNTHDERRQRRSAYSIRQAFLFTMLAVVLRLFYAITELVLTSLGRF